jgi:hypothetical protein
MDEKALKGLMQFDVDEEIDMSIKMQLVKICPHQK